MKARRIVLTEYELPHLPLQTDGRPCFYNVRDSLIQLCFLPELGLNGAALLEANKLAQSISAAEDGFILLSEEDWSKLTTATSLHRGFIRNDVELVRRVEEAPQVEVEERKK